MSNIHAVAPEGIDGWLLLVVARLVTTPILHSYFLLTSDLPIFSNRTWEALTSVGSPAYHHLHLWAPVLILKIVCNVVSIVLGLVTLWFLFRKSKRTPIFAIAWLAFSTISPITDYFLVKLILAVAAKSDPYITMVMVYNIVGTAIWIPYFVVSKRVKATFVR